MKEIYSKIIDGMYVMELIVMIMKKKEIVVIHIVY